MYEADMRRKYKGKVFLFDKCIIYTECVGKHKLAYRGYFRHETLGFTFEDGKSNFVLYDGKKGHREIEFTGDSAAIQLWVQMLSTVLMSTVVLIEKQKIKDNRYRQASKSDLGPLHVLLRLNSPSLSLFDSMPSTSSGSKTVSANNAMTPPIHEFISSSSINSSRSPSRSTFDSMRTSGYSVGERSLTSKITFHFQIYCHRISIMIIVCCCRQLIVIV